MPKGTTIEGIVSCKQASHCWPGGGTSLTAPLALYGRGLSLKTSDRMHASMHQVIVAHTRSGGHDLLWTVYHRSMFWSTVLTLSPDQQPEVFPLIFARGPIFLFCRSHLPMP